ncbi:MAG: tRNA lysidine(34) synthetase TilS [Gemmatimonadaceae bacterium]
MPAPFATIDAAVRAALARRVVLAVSGGRDSMVLLDAAARLSADRIARVATFDHGTGAAARRAAATVERRARELSLEVSIGRAPAGLRTEAAWREARWRFLRAISADAGVPIATAHTRDDQLETILLRVLRGAGARGLAGLAAPSETVRPLLGVPRDAVARYARAYRVAFEHDPSNDSMQHLRNRVRHELLPALLRVSPSLAGDLLRLGARAAALRSDLDRFIDTEVPFTLERGTLTVARPELRHYDADALRTLWPALAARVGATLDRRGTERIAEFTTHGANGGRMQLAGGYEALLHRDELHLRRAGGSRELGDARSLRDGVRLGAWHFRAGRGDADRGLWEAALPAAEPLTVRCWRPGDRMVAAGEAAPRRLKGLLRDARVAASDRPAWPVVLSGGEIVWIPGVRRGSAATDRSGMPVAWFRCERTND